MRTITQAFAGGIALITGAGSDIGAGLARQRATHLKHLANPKLSEPMRQILGKL